MIKKIIANYGTILVLFVTFFGGASIATMEPSQETESPDVESACQFISRSLQPFLDEGILDSKLDCENTPNSLEVLNYWADAIVSICNGAENEPASDLLKSRAAACFELGTDLTAKNAYASYMSATVGLDSSNIDKICRYVNGRDGVDITLNCPDNIDPAAICDTDMPGARQLEYVCGSELDSPCETVSALIVGRTNACGLINPDDPGEPCEKADELIVADTTICNIAPDDLCPVAAQYALGSSGICQGNLPEDPCEEWVLNRQVCQTPPLEDPCESGELKVGAFNACAPNIDVCDILGGYHESSADGESPPLYPECPLGKWVQDVYQYDWAGYAIDEEAGGGKITFIGGTASTAQCSGTISQSTSPTNLPIAMSGVGLTGILGWAFTAYGHISMASTFGTSGDLVKQAYFHWDYDCAGTGNLVATGEGGLARTVGMASGASCEYDGLLILSCTTPPSPVHTSWEGASAGTEEGTLCDPKWGKYTKWCYKVDEKANACISGFDSATNRGTVIDGASHSRNLSHFGNVCSPITSIEWVFAGVSDP